MRSVIMQGLVLCAVPTARLALALHTGYLSKQQQPTKGKDISQTAGHEQGMANIGALAQTTWLLACFTAH